MMEEPQSDPARIKAVEEGTPIGSAREQELLAEVTRLHAERDQIRQAIHPTADTTWEHRAFVALAGAHRQDSYDVDSFEASKDAAEAARDEAQRALADYIASRSQP